MIPYDPTLIFGNDDETYGQPMLPAGYNSVPLARDEYNGAGLNEVIEPVTFASDEVLFVLSLDETHFEVFKCPSWVAAGENRTIPIPEERRVIEITKRCAA